jgi:GNAT superfamily N-acetyltransferase
MDSHGDDRSSIDYELSVPPGIEEINRLFEAAWPHHEWTDFSPVLERSLVFVCAREAGRLVGFVTVAWDGGVHAFLLDTTVHPDWQRRGTGSQLVHRAALAARSRGSEWLHVDYEPHLATFYRGCGFRHTEAGLIDLTAGNPAPG